MTTALNPCWIKVCCIQSAEEAQMAAAAGATAIGLVSAMPSGPGPIPEDEIASIVHTVPDGVQTVLLTSATMFDAIAQQIDHIRPNAVQLVDRVGDGVIPKLRSTFPDLSIIDVIHVTSAMDVEAAVIRSEHADALLLDSGAPDKAVKELGGTGRTHDWSLSRQIVRRVQCPVWLAGGLKPENVGDAIDAVRPRGVDVCSGLRPKGALDPERLAAFVNAVGAAC